MESPQATSRFQISLIVRYVVINIPIDEKIKQRRFQTVALTWAIIRSGPLGVKCWVLDVRL